MNAWDEMNTNVDIDRMRLLNKTQSKPAVKQRKTGSKTRRKGKDGESIAKEALIAYGVKLPHKIANDIRLIYTGMPGRNGQKMFYAVPGQKVVGDFFGVLPGGRMVFVEVKARDSERLVYSALAEHQRQALDNYHSLGALSLLVWVRGGQAKIYEWPIVDFVPRSSLKWD